jgi:FAD/FMN-containing dehydrogenase
VIQCVNFARAHNLLVAVRGGGHNIGGNAVCDGGLTIDLSRMTSVRVDPARRIARAEPGLTWREFDRETQAFGLATTGGQISTTGIAGLTLGGGWGYLARRYGLSCDNLQSVDVVTADGQLLTASAAENADLFFGVRGGGGNFGVATSFEYRLHPVSTVLSGIVAYPFQKAKEVLQLFRELTSAAPTSWLLAWCSSACPMALQWRASSPATPDRSLKANASSNRFAHSARRSSIRSGQCRMRQPSS